MAMARDGGGEACFSGLIDDTQAHSVFPAATVRLEGFLEDQALPSASDRETAFAELLSDPGAGAMRRRADAHRAATART